MSADRSRIAAGIPRRLGKFFSVAASATALATVCLLPWLHGGRVPEARLLLQAGMILAGGLSLVAGLCRGRQNPLPLVVVPLLLLAAIGLIQLLPIHQPLIDQMDHAVNSELRDVFATAGSESAQPGTAAPSATRFLLAQLIALMLLAIVAADELGSRRGALVCLTVLTLNAAVNAVLGTLQLFSGRHFLMQSHWWTGEGTPFSSFVNPNGAAGWLCLGLSTATGLLILQLPPRSQRTESGRKSLAGTLSQFADSVRIYLAGLNTARILTWLAFLFIGVAIASSLSRGGITAAVAGLLVVVAARLTLRQLPAGILLAVIATLPVAGLLVLFEMDERILTELRTLQDPVTQAGSRLAHWSDTLSLLRDFPWLGSGLGAYRFSTLPYQQHDTGAWFRHADNQFLETLVEAGFPGLLAIVLVGMIGLVLGWRLLRSGTRKAAATYDTGNRVPEAVGAAVLMAVVTQSVSGLLDFGLGLPPAASLLVLLTAVASHQYSSQRQTRSMPSGQPQTSFCHVPLPPSVGFAVRVSLIGAAACFVPDLTAATRVHPTIVAARQALNAPVSATVLNQRAEALQALEAAVGLRPDDAELHWTRASAVNDALRRELLSSALSVSDYDNEALQQAWKLTTPRWLADRIAQLQTATGPRQADQLRQQVRALLNSVRFAEITAGIRQQVPLMPLVSEQSAAWNLIAGITDQASLDLQEARFIEPNQTQMFFRLGTVAVRVGDTDLGTDLWRQGLQITNSRIRGMILEEAANHYSADEVLQKFGPETYLESVQALSAVRNPQLRTQLIQRADLTWMVPPQPAEPELRDARIAHLSHAERPDELVQWLRQCLTWAPDEVRYRKLLAMTLERQGQLQQSLEEWRRIEFLAPTDTSVQSAIQRIRARQNSQP